VLCQEARSAEYVPATGSPLVLTATFSSVPPAAATVIPFAGSARLVPSPGVIVTTGPVRDGLGAADRVPLAGALAAAAAPPPFTARTVAVPPPVQAATATTSAALAAAAQNARIALISTLCLSRGMAD
jgi:hypothetical protein